MRKMRPIYVMGILSVAVPLAIAEEAMAASFTSQYVFGDSLVDDGNFLDFSGGTFPPQEYYYQGRFSNGQVFVELLPEKLGFEYDSEHNFAFGGSGTGNNHIEPTLGSLLGLPAQIDTFLGQEDAIASDALFIVSSGANDYFSSLNFEDGIDDEIQFSVTNLEQAITRLSHAGAVNFLVSSLPDLSRVPINLDAPPVERSLLGELSKAHNLALQNSVAALSEDLAIDITLFDLDRVYEQDFGLILGSACTDINIATVASNPPTEICDNPDEHLFWDLSHPTAVGHEVLAELAAAALISEQSEATAPIGKEIPEPSTLLATLGLLGGGYGLKRRRS